MLHDIVSQIFENDLVFDVGANVGDKAQWFIDRGASVVCIEPQPEMAKVVRQRFASVPNVYIEEKALGAQNTIMSMSICSASPVISTLAPHWKTGRFHESAWDSVVDVEVVRLDELIEKYGVPKYCKIDVEGFELEVIGGLTSKIGIISYEFTSEYIGHAMQIVEALIKLGYKEFNVSVGESPSFNNVQWLTYYDLVHLLMHSSANIKNLWGDIYAR